MRPEFYADNFRRYNAFFKNYSGNKLYRIACGPSEDDYAWTDTVMSIAGTRMNGLSLHYYTVPTGSWKGSKGSATRFDEAEWITTLRRTLRMEELIAEHSAIMDRYDPERRSGSSSTNGAPGTTSSPGPTPASSSSRIRSATRSSPAFNLNIFNATPTGSHGQHRPARQRAPVDGPDGRPADGHDADLPRLRPVKPPGRGFAAGRPPEPRYAFGGQASPRSARRPPGTGRAGSTCRWSTPTRSEGPGSSAESRALPPDRSRAGS